MGNGNKIVVSSGSKALALQTVRSWMLTLPADSPKLGVSRGYIVRLVDRHGLSAEDLDTLLDARSFGAGFGKMNVLLKKFTPIEVMSMYEIRKHVIAGLPQDIASISLKRIVKFVRRFPSSSLGEEEGMDASDVASKIVDAVLAVRNAVRWIKYSDAAIDFLCSAAEYFDLADVETAIEVVEQGYRSREEH